VEDAKRLRERAEQARRLSIDVSNAAYRAQILKLAEEWEREAVAFEAAQARYRDSGGS
jgi:hypothetical protein